ncbi:prepilin peptidase [Mycobacterium neglectum]|uniref:prepilin peptidase n=1 Tax=Mycobacterium neglectum TaxID=242737 RepID=UPI003CCC3D3D
MAGVCVVAWLIVLSWHDIRDRRLPNWLTIPGAVVVLATATTAGRGVPALAGSAALFAVYLTIHLVLPAAMGAGDVKLALGIGALTGSFGIDVWTLAAVGAPLLTAAAALLLRSEVTVPHGPSMCLAATGAVALAVL